MATVEVWNTTDLCMIIDTFNADHRESFQPTLNRLKMTATIMHLCRAIRLKDPNEREVCIDFLPTMVRVKTRS